MDRIFMFVLYEWNNKKSGTLLYTLVHLSTLWYTLVNLSTLWYTLVHPSTHWYTLVKLHPSAPTFGIS